MSKCDCYYEEIKKIPVYSMFTGLIIDYEDISLGKCNGTKERESCSCNGDRTKCDFYPEVREKALKKQKPKFGEWISVEDRLPEKK